MDKKGKLVVIGGDAAGMSAALKVRREQPKREIVVFEKGEHTPYAACGMPYYIAGMVDSYDDLIARKPEVFRKKQNIAVHIRHEVIAIDLQEKWVEVRNLEKDEVFRESSDSLLIATGASPLLPDLPGIRSKGVFALSSLQSGMDIFRFLEEEKPGKAVIVGGGYIGIEMAEAFLERGLEVSMLDMAPQVMSTLDPDIATVLSDYMQAEGVTLYLEEKLQEIEINEKGSLTRVVTEKRTLDADLVILGLGIKPNAGLAGKAGIALGANGAVRVDKKMQTSAEAVWAAGDCATSYHLVKQEETYVALGTVANKHGLVAGINLSGGDVEFPGVLGTAITKFRELEIARTGISEKEANEMGLKFRAAKVDTYTRSAYYPESGKITVKLLAEKESGWLLGGQIVGKAGAGKRIDTLATAIASGMTAQQVVDLDLAYAPPFSPVWDPVQTAARRLV
ncbi:MAG: FAD-dependent oxidoreductase [Bacteroidales bacterium]|jgi:NADPH-dependent 2,4-dienoyl-CoA reductase/sulfur reductase-like enzyme|nr:FAD-dependent oxidoreductase [Bacteroidales bacterium]NLM92758.1 FAD-dependent oxidoreductase [Bacteroidales bacterium]